MSQENLLQHTPSVIRQVKSTWADFIDFVASENALQVTVGLITANGSTKVINSFVSDILLPSIALFPAINLNPDERFVIIRRGPQADPNYSYSTLAQAAADGAVVLAYGKFVDNVVNFLVLGMFLYFISRVNALFTKETTVKHTAKCAFCRKCVPEKAKRCSFCTSWLDGREERETSALGV